MGHIMLWRKILFLFALSCSSMFIIYILSHFVLAKNKIIKEIEISFMVYQILYINNVCIVHVNTMCCGICSMICAHDIYKICNDLYKIRYLLEHFIVHVLGLGGYI